MNGHMVDGLGSDIVVHVADRFDHPDAVKVASCVRDMMTAETLGLVKNKVVYVNVVDYPHYVTVTVYSDKQTITLYIKNNEEGKSLRGIDLKNGIVTNEHVYPFQGMNRDILCYIDRDAWKDVMFEFHGKDPLGKVSRDFMFEDAYKAYMAALTDSDESIDTLDIVRVEYHVQPDYDYFPNVIVRYDYYLGLGNTTFVTKVFNMVDERIQNVLVGRVTEVIVFFRRRLARQTL